MRSVAIGVAGAMLGLMPPPAVAQAPPGAKVAQFVAGAEDRAKIRAKLEELDRAVDALASGQTRPGLGPDTLADVAVFRKAATWAERFEEYSTPKLVAQTLDILDRGLDRAAALGRGEAPWTKAKGPTGRGFVSAVDGSVQPYALVRPVDAVADPSARLRLDVVLHGRSDLMNEVAFLASHDGRAHPDDGQGGLTLHVYGRGNNAYRWAGEADVFEAIAAVRRNEPVDEGKLVLRGFSMGGAGAWHLGLHHPDAWRSVEAGAGFSETLRYAKLADVTDVRRRALRIYDANDYTLNAFNLPMIGYGGEDDPQKQAAINIQGSLESLGFAMKTEGLVTRGVGIDFARVVGAGMKHKVDPASRAILDAFHDARVAEPPSTAPRRVRFITHTLKYPRAGWLTIGGLVDGSQPAILDGTVEGEVASVSTRNVEALAVQRRVAEDIVLDGQKLPLRPAAGGLLPDVYYRRSGDDWKVLDHDDSRALQENVARAKRPGVQGPIDDAFMSPFLCVRGTGAPWNADVARWADARLARFAELWERRLRGQIRIKDDVNLTPEDIEAYHLVLFGDPGSNRVLARALPDLPIGWTRSEVDLGGKYPAADHAPALIAANPLNPRRYAVVNSGHTFGDREFAGSNAQLYPRLGDYAVFKLGEGAGTPVVDGYFDERWRRP